MISVTFSNWSGILKFSKQVFIITIFLLISISSAQWNIQSPVPTHLDVRGVGASTAQRVFIATDDNSFDNGGSLFESNDGGSTWVQRNIPFTLSDPFNGLFFLDSQNGWAYGNDNYRTTDGGTTWTQLPFLGSTYFMKFYSTFFGLATGNFDRYVSHDGGDSWVPSPDGIFSFDFIDDLNGLGVSETGIYKTIDGGNTFTLEYSGDAKSVVFLTSTVAVSISDDTFLRSTDGGLTWNTVTTANGKFELLAVSSDVVLAWGRTGIYPDYDDKIFRSSDGGQNWIDLGEVIQEGIFAFAVPDFQTIVVSDLAGNMFRSADAGLNWNQTFVSRGQMPGYLSSASPYFADAQTGYFGYGAGFIIKTTDGGASWTQISSGTGENINDVDRFPNGNLIAVGDNGTLLTSDGFSQWIIHEKLSQNDLNAIQVLDANEVLVVDKTGQVYRSTDGGESWTATAGKPVSMTSAEDIQFTNSLDGWVIGQSFTTGALYHTTDGGTTWVPVTEFLGSYKSVDVEGANIWAANVGEIFYRSTDNGATWVQGQLPYSPVQISDMEFFNESIGYAVGWWGQAYRSSDGGETWTILPTPNADDNFTDIYLLGANELWISTNNDVAYYSATGGQSWSVLDIGSTGFGSFNSIVAIPGGDAWTVGYQGFIERFIGPPPPPANQLPVASFDFVATGLTVDFTDTSFDPDGFIVSWEWNFGDGTGSTQQNPSHTYDTANTYIVTLTVTDNEGATGNGGHIIVVQPDPGGTFGDFTEVTPLDSIFITPQDEDFWVISTAPADYDNDGDLDIAVLGYYVVYNQSVEDKLLLLRNDGPVDSTKWGFSYIEVPFGNLSSGASDLAWGDADGDGDLDLAVGTDGVTVLYRNDAGFLKLTDTELPEYWEDNDQAYFDLRSITWADFDNDGDADLLIPSVFDNNTFSFRTALLRNDGPNGTGGWIFTETDSVFAPTEHAQSSWADFDGDQDLDLLLVNAAPLYDNGFIRRYMNDGNGNFTPENILGNLSIEHGEAQWGDYDGDGDLDILVAGNIKEIDSTYSTVLRIYRNDSETYVPFEVIDCLPCEGWFDITAATWADYDSDGDMDILVAGTYNSGSEIEGRARIYTNDNGIFTESGNELPAPLASGSRGGTFSWFDIDGEGDLDYFIAGQYFVPGGNGLVEAQMHIYRNDVAVQNNAPSAPTGLNALLQGNDSVLLSWLMANDDHTPAPAITYDLRIVRAGTHVPSNNPMEPILTRLPEPGNISAVTEWALTGLPDGLYSWELRAVDAAYVGSEVISGEFTIGAITGTGNENTIPKEYSIEQNYPNPFNPSTVIKYSIPEAGLVTLKVYNIIGEEVSTLVNDVKQAGNYLLKFDASNFASGVYFYRINAGKFTEVKKMILSK
jgi:photosystem II stability/assembly factor-like uncharacterized protein/PKD repeat protein